MGIAKGIINNGVVVIIQRVIRILDQLLLVPFFLTSWGANYYGEWLTLSIIPSVMAFSDLGFGSAVCNSFVLAYVSGRKQEAANLNKSGLLLISCSVILGIIFTAIVLFFCRNFGIFNKSIISAQEAMLAVIFMITARLFSFYFQLGEGYFRSVRRAALGGLLGSLQSIISLIVGICLLSFGCRIVGYAFSQCVISVLFTCIYLKIGAHFVKLEAYRGIIRLPDIKQIIKTGFGYLMTPIWQSIYFQGSTLVVRLFLGPANVAVFNTIRTVCRSVNQLYSIINGSVFPDLQYEYACGNMEMVHRVFRFLFFVSLFIGTLGSILLALFGLDVYELWTQSILFVPQHVWWVFVFGTWINALWWNLNIVYSITNRPYNFAIMGTISACVSVTISYLLSINYDLWGAALGSVVFDFIMLFYVLPNSCHLLGMRVKDLYLHMREDYNFIHHRILSRK